MHIEILVEDSSGKRLLDCLLPQMLGEQGQPNTWRLHHYKGVSRIPPGLKASSDPAKRMLLDQLPRLLRGYGKTPGIDAVVVVLDSDRRDCVGFLAELRSLVHGLDQAPHTLFRLAIEEVAAWYLGDRTALAAAYPSAKQRALDSYVQDSVCGTWEVLANAIYPAVLPRSRRPAGRCQDSSSMSGQRRSALRWTSSATRRQASANCVMDCGD